MGELLDIEDVLRKVQGGLDNGDFTLLYLWVTFRAKGGRAGRIDLDTAVRGRHSLSDSDAHVLRSVIEQLRDS
ncbi:hypothetical protein OOZ51_19635 [Arthrobacter sp. MI7-26]|uniref:hypothetical protein n=1 Tax=Arthrobacter sp. MI7-26 TaxID=2993653 RepID=UPI002248F701|nr:hypothetical protein [Arthrobacter sp. MI7-26]MCX2750002.1 hypothetical protein [Arthrobacter sp. MI7-26]